jgi:hypothetical protein
MSSDSTRQADARNAAEPEPGDPVAPYPQAGNPEGERQDGASVGGHPERSEADPAGGTAARRLGGADPAAEGAPGGVSDGSDRGRPATFKTGSAVGSGSSAGGGGSGEGEDIDSDSMSGGGGQASFSAHRPRN